MIWPFKRKSPPSLPPLVDEQNWKLGDIAGCIEAGWVHQGVPVDGPKVGTQSLVTGIYEGKCNGDPCFGLHLTGWPLASYRADHFRKVTLIDTNADRSVADTLNLENARG